MAGPMRTVRRSSLCILGKLTLITLIGSAGAQSYGPGYNGGRPVSATINDISGQDPAGRNALVNALGNPDQYIGQYKYVFPTGLYAIDPSIDPSVTSPIPGNDPGKNGSWRVVGNAGTIAGHAIPVGYDTVFVMGRPTPKVGAGDHTPLPAYLAVNNGADVEYHSFFNMSNNVFAPFHIAEAPFCSGHAYMPNGKVLMAGGMMATMNAPWYTIGYQAIRVVDMQARTYSVVATSPTGRWYPTVATQPDGNMLIVGGAQEEVGIWGSSQTPKTGKPAYGAQCVPNTGAVPADPYYDNPTYQIFDSSTYELSPPLTLTILLESWPINTYPFVVVLPTGSNLVVAGSQMEALHFTKEGAKADQLVGDLPQLPVPVNYPVWASLVLLPLQGPDYKAEVLIAGGSADFCSNNESPGGTASFLIDVSPGGNHTVITEQAAFPRVMSDATLLPDGRIFLCNGAAVGLAGGGAPNYSVANNGSTVAEIYDPTKPIGQRWSTVADSQIWRMYHSSAYLTPNAEVFVGGSESTSEHRIQLYTPDYLQNGKPRPVITAAPDTLTYSQNFTINYSNVSSTDRIVLHRFASATHGNHFDQRQVVLACSPSATSTSCQSPPNSSVAPPGPYMIFALYQGVPSAAKLTNLTLSQPASGPASGPQASAPQAPVTQSG